MMTQGQVLTSDPAKVVWGHRGHQQVFADNLRLERARDMKVVSMCLSRQYASLICNLGQAVTLTWGQILTLTFQGHAIHVSMRLEEANTMVSKLLLYHFKHRSYHWKLFRSKMPFLTFRDLWRLNGWILGEIWRHLSERAFQELSFAFFWIWRSYYSSRDNGRHSW